MKQYSKTIIFFIAKVIVFPLICLHKLFPPKGSNDSFFCALGQFLSLLPGKTGSFLRVAFYSATLSKISPHIHIGFGSYFAHPDVEIGDKVYIGAYCIIGKCSIGQDALIGSFVNILSGSRQHIFTDLEQPIQQQGGEFIRINIGENCWIGNNSTLMTSIGNNCIIGAGSVVVNEIQTNAIAVGNPCRMIRERNITPTDKTEKN